jgi:hypothetical protein
VPRPPQHVALPLEAPGDLAAACLGVEHLDGDPGAIAPEPWKPNPGSRPSPRRAPGARSPLSVPPGAAVTHLDSMHVRARGVDQTKPCTSLSVRPRDAPPGPLFFFPSSRSADRISRIKFSALIINSLSLTRARWPFISLSFLASAFSSLAHEQDV